MPTELRESSPNLPPEFNIATITAPTITTTTTMNIPPDALPQREIFARKNTTQPFTVNEKNLDDNFFEKFSDTRQENTLNKDLCNLFRIQAIQDMSSLSSITVAQLIQILDFDIVGLNYFKKAFGFVSVDGNFHLRLGFRNLLECLLLLVKSKKKSLVKNLELTHDHIENDIF
ncbi:unnamed protein product [Rotaria sordida]|uniref:Uncharacterized protein n=1 Tax=Rotaria sordida TaxID=392033 RepID=A0A819SL82_9BILA|nr:unnamed protein product [Rotaria sordida]